MSIVEEAAGRQSNLKFRWQCCHLSRANSNCLWCWASKSERDAVTEKEFNSTEQSRVVLLNQWTKLKNQSLTL